MIQTIGIVLILISIGLLIFWLTSGKRSKPLLKWGCLFIAVVGFLLVMKDKLVEVTIKDWLTIKTAATEATADAKTIAEIKQQVENQRAVIDLIAASAQNAKNLSELASNKVSVAEQKIKVLDEAIEKANEALRQLDAATEFTLLVTKAAAGDRSSFFSLVNYQSANAAEAKKDVLNSIIQKIESEAVSMEHNVWLWQNFGIDPDKSSLQQFKDYFSKTFEGYPGGRFFVCKQVFNDSRFSELDRFDFLAAVIQNEKHLLVLQEACRLMDTKRKSNRSFTDADAYLEWHKENRAGLKTTP